MEQPKEKPKEELEYFVRIANTDLEGNKPIYHSLTKIKGVGAMFANMICTLGKVDKLKKTGYLTKEEVAIFDEILSNPAKFNAPEWMMNRRKDPDDNVSRHIITSTLDFTKDNDIKLMKRMKTYKGVRHSIGQPVRGQKTRSNFRKNKGKVVGVRKTPQAKAADTKKKEK